MKKQILTKLMDLEDIRKQNKNHDHKTVGFMSGKNNPGYTNGAYTAFCKEVEKLPNYCQLCGATQCRLEAHHIDGDRTNNANNLIRLCSSCHKKEQYKLGRTKQGEKGYPVFLSKIKEIIFDDVRNTYDVTMSAPNHNFVVKSGIVTSNSHSISYGELGYWAAYLKSHFPLLFFAKWLSFAKHKLKGKQEIRDLIRDTKNFDIKVNNPSILHLSSDFTIVKGEIYFGLSNIKSIGEAMFAKLEQTIKETEKTTKPISQYTWNDFLIKLFPRLSKTIVTNLILVGAFDHLKYPRTKMVYEYNIINQLTDKEIKQLQLAPEESLIERMSKLNPSKVRVKIVNSLIDSIKKPSINFEDNLVWLNKTEEDLLGIPLSVTKLETCDNIDADTTCKEFKDGKSGNVKLSVEIVQCNEKTVKNGNNKGAKMAFLAVEDDSGLLDNIAVFPEIWHEFKNVLYEGNTILMEGYKSKKNSLVLQKVFQI
jgi:DNA polymerase-3 subunit alpha